MTRPLLPLHNLQLLPSPKATQYFIVQTHGRATGQDKGTGERTMDTLCFCFLFFKENTVYFRLTETFRALLCSIRPSVYLFKVPGCKRGDEGLSGSQDLKVQILLIIFG